MSQLTCPFCGERELDEFAFRHTVAAATCVNSPQAVYARSNDPSNSLEFWQHVRGCRAWLQVRRNPSTGAVHDIKLLTGGVDE